MANISHPNDPSYSSRSIFPTSHHSGHPSKTKLKFIFTSPYPSHISGFSQQLSQTRQDNLHTFETDTNSKITQQPNGKHSFFHRARFFAIILNITQRVEFIKAKSWLQSHFTLYAQLPFSFFKS